MSDYDYPIPPRENYLQLLKINAVVVDEINTYGRDFFTRLNKGK